MSFADLIAALSKELNMEMEKNDTSAPPPAAGIFA